MAALLVALPAPRGDAATAGTVHHVAASGTDTTVPTCAGGTSARPWRTIGFSFRCLQPGDTLLLHGDFREVVSVPTRAGTAEQPIVVTGAPGEPRPTIAGSLRIEDPSWWTVQDIEVIGDGGDYDTGGRHPLKLLGGSHWTVQRVELHDAASYALFRVTPDSGGRPASHWRLLDSCIHDTIPAHGTPAEPPYPDHNLYIYTGEGAGPGLIEGNVVFGAPNGQNIKLGERDGTDAADNVTVRFNTLVDAAQNISVVGPSDDNLIERNILAEVSHGEPWYPNVRGIHLHGDDNVARDNAWSGAAQAVHSRTGNTTSVIDGGNVEVAPGFESRGCDGFLPLDPAAAPYGAHGREVAQTSIPVERLAGEDRISTAVKVSRAVHDRADTVVLARADAYPDALASSALAGLRGGPVLLTPPDRVPDVVLEEIGRLGASRAILLGGPAALGPAVEEDLRAHGIARLVRLAGADRFATAGRVADEVRRLRAAGTAPPIAWEIDEVILVEGANPDPTRGWPDAVSAGQLAAASGTPVLLTTAHALPEATRSWLTSHTPDVVTIVGGTVAVSDDVAAEVGTIAGRVQRIAGPDRYATAERVAIEVATRRGSAAPPANVFVASGLRFPDALAVGPAAALSGGAVVLYGQGDDAYTRLRDFLRPVDPDRLRVTVIGGALAVPSTLEQRWKLDVASTG